MSPRIMKVLSFLIVILLAAGSMVAKEKDGNVKKVKGTENIMGSPSRTHFNINNVSTWLYNNGESDIKPDGNSGFIFPKGSNQAAVFQSGFVWGATVNGQKRAGGATYDSGLLPGRIIGSGPTAVREDSDLEHVRIYRVRRDYANPDADFTGEINDGEGTEDEIMKQYDLDWTNWPAEYGAPYEDVNSSGSYEPESDIPGVVGADQTVWFVANDLDAATCISLYGSDPMGIEMQATYWGYNQTNALGNMMFRKYKIVNKSINSFDSMYVSMWADPDLGDASDDFSGADVDLSMMYTYNGNASDAVYGKIPPAVGFDFFQGPIVPAPGETAIFNGKYKQDFKNLPMSAHYFFINGDPVYTDPDLGEYTGTLQFHNLFEGKISTTGAPMVDPTIGAATKFALSGDPITGTGWVDGILHQPGDRRQGMVAGPFNMAAGDTQEVVVAELIAGAFEGVDRLAAVQLLKFYDLVAQNTYDNFFNVPAPVTQPVVEITELNQEVILKWNADPAVEDYESNGYEFQGYVVYQFPTKSSTLQDAKIVATYDLKDGIGKVFGPDFDTEAGAVLVKVLKQGSDSGIRRFVSLKSDEFKSGAKLNNGSSYYFGVTAYALNPNDLTIVPTLLESAPIIFDVIPQATESGYSNPVTHSSDLEITHNGTADATSAVKVIEPFNLTGDDYAVDFKQVHYYKGTDGQWHVTNYADSIGKFLSKDISPAYLTGVSFIASEDTRDINFTVQDLGLSPDYSWCDGIELTFPAGVNVLNALPSGNNGPVGPVINGQVVTWGAEDTTTGGPFSGGELLTVTISGNIALPLNVDYIMWDDGWGTAYGYPGGFIHATGTVSVTEEAYYFRTENNWRVTNVTTDNVVLDNQRVFDGIDQYADYWEVPAYVGADAAPIVDGFQVSVDGSFAAPFSLGSFDTEATDVNSTYDITDYGMHGWAASGRSSDAFGNGVTTIELLQKDYELRFTGVYEAPDANGVVYVKEGTGSIATIYHARGMDGIGVHPMNPNPGSADPFHIRVPFEVWNIDDDIQVNLLVLDRLQAADANPFYAFNPADRMYCEINNTPYDPTYVNSGDPANADTDNLTWNLVFWTTDWTIGDKVVLNYANPLQIGKDTFTFGTDASSYSIDKAKIDVEKINVFPNPYYGVNPNEINKYQRYVTFNHLPTKATLRVFNLAGQLVKTVVKDDDTQFARWSLTNENGLPAASGVYVVYIDLPDLGETKILKVAVIQETQILDRY